MYGLEPPFLISLCCLHFSLRISTSTSQSLLHFWDFFGSFSTCLSLLRVSPAGVQKKGPETTVLADSPQAFGDSLALPVQVPAEWQH